MVQRDEWIPSPSLHSSILSHPPPTPVSTLSLPQTLLWSPRRLLNTTTWISDRHSNLPVRNAANNSPSPTSAPSPLFPCPLPIHVLAQETGTTLDHSFLLSPTFDTSLSPDHVTSKTSLKCMHFYPASVHHPQAGRHHLSSGTTEIVLLDFFLPFSSPPNPASPPSNPEISLRCTAPHNP